MAELGMRLTDGFPRTGSSSDSTLCHALPTVKSMCYFRQHFCEELAFISGASEP
jgi:hypothetical protein